MPEDLEGPQKMPRMFGGLTARSVALGVILTLILSWAVGATVALSPPRTISVGVPILSA